MSEEYIRKDVYEADKDHFLDLIADLHKKIDDLNHNITLWGIGLTCATLLITILLAFLR